ncbi:SAM-dependent methyltransferase [Aquabacter spiritensis]|uniref:Cyclopropane-fatty-acyl-phospholipid synthase n=1 Tax=Aquabacter spiritensis TaxID=933073 RepID=A0A4R3M3V3_9HYPH|nr:cyclopropane-fatty-acyl-phospholipid synthase family protein [Aquabacter spiritensis]TCT06929.1 cyclopropane-fatty-acyl-phospholipid synthase [Aquabacter spiritensis]
MTLIATANRMVERIPIPDAVTRFGIDVMVGRTRRRLARLPDRVEGEFARAMADYPVAVHTADANAQHYELPADFFGLVLGPHRKYSCCLYPEGTETLAEAEARALAETAAHAGLADGQHILELGCGWGSLTLFIAERFPASRIVAVSNSASQRRHILAAAAARGLGNIEVVTADMNDFSTGLRFDRVVSVEMFEHMSNWPALLARIRTWLTPEGRLFVHVFTHRRSPYRFDHGRRDDWIARYFFTGGIMPSAGLIRNFSDQFEVEADWCWDGGNYARTAEHWLENFDANRDRIDPIFARIYGPDAALWGRRWRLFFLATAGLFGHDRGREWAVHHYRLRPSREPVLSDRGAPRSG